MNTKFKRKESEQNEYQITYECKCFFLLLQNRLLRFHLNRIECNFTLRALMVAVVVVVVVLLFVTFCICAHYMFLSVRFFSLSFSQCASYTNQRNIAFKPRANTFYISSVCLFSFFLSFTTFQLRLFRFS